MKFTIDPKLLADLVGWTARAVPLRPTVPILSGLLLDADGDQLTVSAFDYDVSASGHAPADVAEPGRIVLPGRLLSEVAKNLPTKSFVEITAGDRDATLTCGRAEYSLPTMPLDDYPNLPTPPQPAGTIDADTLTAAVNQVHPATTNDTTRPMLTGIRIDTDGEQFTLAATDRYRIAVTDTTWQPHAAPLAALIPGSHLADIAKGLGHGAISIGIDNGMAAIATPDRTTTIRLIDEQFIDYRSRTTVDQPITATVDAATLAAAVKRVALVADRKTTAVRLNFTASEVVIRASDADGGRGSEAVDCKLAGADSIEIGFQAQFLTDALNAIPGTARIGMEASTRPALFSSEDGRFTCLVMALRLT
ncbi:DNA polymerase III subunit beta [Nonomuraea sp. SBT364]|uniref:DNA polymerase III subunit beta n=1 Tax=Nonomuraea sp. SBT364 TaxID=1580530 RepID=UPI0007C81A85|nr:DNA polymerase III subunit beta [Nonomuraea sp. SBT364]